jgi:hypothetical protein
MYFVLDGEKNSIPTREKKKRIRFCIGSEILKKKIKVHPRRSRTHEDASLPNVKKICEKQQTSDSTRQQRP